MLTKLPSHDSTPVQEPVVQIPADWKHYFDFINMTSAQFQAQWAFQDSASYLRQYGIPYPSVLLDEPQFSAKAELICLFEIGPATYRSDAFAVIMNPTIVVVELMRAGAIPQVSPIMPFIPPSHKPKPVEIDFSDLSKAVGVELQGYPIRTWAVVDVFQGKVQPGTQTVKDGMVVQLVDSGNFMNRTGVWQLQQ